MVEVDPAESNPGLQEAPAALQASLGATQTQLQVLQEHSADLYRALHVERRKVAQTKVAKTNAEAHAAEVQITLDDLEDQLEQLTLKNEQLEMTMSKLLEKWAEEKQLASDTLQDCRRKVSALQAECKHAPETLKRQLRKHSRKETSLL